MNHKHQYTKVLVIGIDGLDPGICREMMRDGELKNLGGLAREGVFSDLATANPPQSPVAWSSLAVGADAGVHGVYDFIVRDPKTYLPGLSVLKKGRAGFEPAFAGTPFWDVVAKAGLPAVVLRWPLTFPPGQGGARILPGLGAPDIKGRLGNYLYLAERLPEGVVDGRGQAARVVFVDGKAAARLEGPAVAALGKRVALGLDLEFERSDGRLVVRAGETAENLEPGRWSGWIPLVFEGPDGPERGMTRMYPTRLDPLELYVGPLQIDPLDPSRVLTAPAGYAAELAGALGGRYATLGMPEETKGLTEDRLSDEAFLEMCREITDERERMLEFELGRFERGLLACVFDTSDRIQHMYWRLRDTTHPLYDPALREKLGPVIEDHYRRMDAMLGRARGAAGPDTAVIVVSDHGMCAYSRSVNLNRWLAREGYLSLRDHDPADGGELFKHVNWSKTRAYALGFGSLYLNRVGREREGVVRDEEVEALRRELAGKLVDLKDGAADAVSAVYFRETLFSGPLAAEGPDMVVGYRPSYRASWTTAIGGVGAEVFEDNRQKWSGDHCVDAEIVPGSLLSNVRFDLEGMIPTQTRVAATICRLLGLAPAPDMEPSLPFEGEADADAGGIDAIFQSVGD